MDKENFKEGVLPYDPRPASKGGNRGIDEEFSREPEKKGWFRVIGVDLFDGTDWVYGDYETLVEAKEVAEKNSERMLKAHIYDDKGNHVGDYGTFWDGTR